MGNVLLTGATGFLGAHLLASIAKNKAVHLHCLVRGKDGNDAAKRLRESLSFYFGQHKTSDIMAKVSVYCSDISLESFGLEEDELNKLLKADTIIHCAAVTDHLGHVDVFEKNNVTGTKNITEFALKAGASLVHVSTTGVSGTHYTEGEGGNGEFDENSYYIGQNYADNVYIKSKFMAEKAVLDALNRGLDARIMRVGMLTATSQGMFQNKPERNAFANRIKALCVIGCVPVSMLDAKIEMTPVDVCAEAILVLMKKQNPQDAVYHVFNTNTMSLAVLISLLEQNNNRIEIISDEEFTQKITEMSKRGEYENLSSLVPELELYGKTPEITVSANITSRQLSKEGFSWPVIDKDYMNLFFTEHRCKSRKRR